MASKPPWKPSIIMIVVFLLALLIVGIGTYLWMRNSSVLPPVVGPPAVPPPA